MTASAIRRAATRHRAWLEAEGWLLALVGYALLALTQASAVLRDGGQAFDLHAYVLAGQHALNGEPLYEAVGIGDAGAYRYAPTFAYLAIPLALAPEPMVTWLARAGAILCVRYLVGSWRAVGWALLFWPLQIELLVINVTLPIAAAARWSLRGPNAAGGAALMATTAALKFGTALLLPYLWLRRAELRRPLAAGAIGLLVVFAVHALLDPPIWQAYFASLEQQSASVNDAPFVGEQLLFLVPSTLWDFVLRLGIGAALVAVAAARGWDWLAYAAATIAVPTLWLARLAALVGVPRLWWEGRLRRGA